jgi:hypothetical protein
MNLSGVNLQQTQLQTSTQAAVVKEGQVLHGTIQKLYPDQQASIQVGDQKMMAKLETPLKAGDAHFFQVTGTSPDLTLKVVSGPLTSQTTAQQAQQLMTSMNLPESKEMQQIVTQFLKNDTPMSRDQLLQAEQLLKATNVPKAEALAALSKIVDLKLPMNEASLQAIIQGSAKTGFQSSLQNLQQLLQNDASLSPALKNGLLDSLMRVDKPLAVETGGAMLGKMMMSLTGDDSATTKQQMLAMLKEANVLPKNANMMNFLSNALGKADSDPHATLQQAAKAVQQNPQDPALKQALQQAIQQHPTLSEAAKSTITAALNRVQIAPTATYTSQLMNAVTKEIAQAPQQTPTQALSALVQSKPTNVQAVVQQLTQAVQQDQQLPQAQKEAIVTQLQQFSATKADTVAIQQLAKHVQQQLVQGYSAQMQEPFQPTEGAKTPLTQLLAMPLTEVDNKLEALAQQVSKTNHPTAQQLLQNTETQLAQQMNGKAFEQVMRHTLQNLGLNYEANLAQKDTNLEQLQQQLKPQLMALLQDESAQPATKQAAEQLVARMNGMHYLSGENGPQHQLIMQVPLSFFGRQTDATLQWNGRMNKDGKIDADYARVMFYLDLASLSETVIDMQVQSRVVNVTVYNDNNLDMLAEPLRASLEKGLAAHDYRLSGVLIKPFERAKTEVQPTLHATTSNGEGGVDLRV